MRNLTIANQLTILRIVLIPAFVLLVVYGRLGAALLVFITAGATDALDGLIARLGVPLAVVAQAYNDSEVSEFSDPLKITVPGGTVECTYSITPASTRIRPERTASGTTWARRKNGSVYREWRSIRAVKDAAGTLTHYVIVFSEVGAQRSQRARRW